MRISENITGTFVLEWEDGYKSRQSNHKLILIKPRERTKYYTCPCVGGSAHIDFADPKKTTLCFKGRNCCAKKLTLILRGSYDLEVDLSAENIGQFVVGRNNTISFIFDGHPIASFSEE